MEDDEIFWKLSITFIALVFTIYPMMKDYYDNPVATVEITISAMVLAFIFVSMILLFPRFIKKVIK